MKIGSGYDVHALAEGRALVLGGIEIPYHLGLEGHSDADVLLHAICDALLGAAGLGDMGEHFPDDDPSFKNAESTELLKKTWQLAGRKCRKIINIDATVLAERPKITPYKDAMRKKISELLSLEPERVNIKASTTEGLGFIGEGKAMAAMCVVLVE